MRGSLRDLPCTPCPSLLLTDRPRTGAPPHPHCPVSEDKVSARFSSRLNLSLKCPQGWGWQGGLLRILTFLALQGHLWPDSSFGPPEAGFLGPSSLWGSVRTCSEHTVPPQRHCCPQTGDPEWGCWLTFIWGLVSSAINEERASREVKKLAPSFPAGKFQSWTERQLCGRQAPPFAIL